MDKKKAADHEALMLAGVVQELTHELCRLQVEVQDGLVVDDDDEFVPDDEDDAAVATSLAPENSEPGDTLAQQRNVQLIESKENKRRYKKDLIVKIQTLIQKFNLRGKNIDLLLHSTLSIFTGNVFVRLD